jgi:hypothetical protein
VESEEIVVILYFVSAIAREFLQLLMGIGRDGYVMGLWLYVSDTWNLMDMVSIITFFAGYNLKNATKTLPLRGDCLLSIGPICLKHMEAPFFWEFQDGEMFYAFSIFFMYIRLLRSFALFQRINVIVKIFIRMLSDVVRFLVMYLIFLVAFSILMVGAGSPSAAIDKCNTMGLVYDDRRKSSSSESFNSSIFAGPGGGRASEQRIPADQEDYEYVTCWQSWWFLRTVFQAFGEFYLDEMTNDWSIVFVIIIFFLMNIVLMNLLIAM